MFILSIIFQALVLVAMAVSAGHAASFDCVRADSEVEKMICAHEDLSTADDLIARLYRAASRTASDRASLNATHRDWIRRRNQASSQEELKKLYDQRIAELRRKHHAASFPKDGGGGQGMATYFSREGELEVNHLGYGKMAFRILVVNHQGHIGQLQGVADIDGSEARYQAVDCDLRFILDGSTVTVRQDFNKGTCGAGLNVAFDGVYTRKGSGGRAMRK